MAVTEACKSFTPVEDDNISLNGTAGPLESTTPQGNGNTDSSSYHCLTPLHITEIMPRAGYDIPRQMGPERPPNLIHGSAPAQAALEQLSGSTTPANQSPGKGKNALDDEEEGDHTQWDFSTSEDLIFLESDRHNDHSFKDLRKQLYIDISNIIRSAHTLDNHASNVKPDGGDEPQSDNDDDHDDDDGDGDDRNDDQSLEPSNENSLTRHYEAIQTPEALFQELLFEKLVSDMRRRGNIKATQNDQDEGARLSSRQLLEQCDNGNIITNFREYQLELFERAKMRNTIVVLDTGSGKTMIAMLLLQFTILQNMEERVEGKPRKIAFFLVPSTPLVFQQARTIQSNLPYAVESLCGALNTDAWDRKKWSETFSKFEIIVCTGEILNHCLRHGFIQMKDICLIIFDETHHAKMNHVYAEISRNHYHSAPSSERPRIFGMTASPINSSSLRVEEQIGELEHLMDSQIITTLDPTLLQHAFARPKEINIYYDCLHENQILELSPLRKRLHEILYPVSEYTKLLNQAKDITQHLGLWAGDCLWKYVLDDDFRYRVERRLNKDHSGDIPLLDDVRRRLDEARDVIRRHPFGDPKPKIPDVSPKVLILIEALKSFDFNSHDKCLVFIEKRITAKLLHAMFSSIAFGPLLLKPGIIIGGGSSNASLGEIRQSVNEQFTSILAFRKGTLNCLFATSVAEEGLDIPDCNIVVRFDLYRTMIQYIQSRGRARHLQSKYYHLLERNNFRHTQVRDLVVEQESIMRHYCKSLPADRRVESTSDDISVENDVIWQHPRTGAKITTQSAVSLIYQISTHFPSTDPDGARAVFVMHRKDGLYQCEVILPNGKAIIGTPATQKIRAKRNAASRTCRYLYVNRFFDDYLVPLITPSMNLQTSDHLALDANKKDAYTKRAKPLQWRWEDDGSLPQELYVCVLDVQANLSRPHLPFCLLTRTPVLPVANFEIFTDSGEVGETKMTYYNTPIRVTKEDLDKYTSYTLRIFQDIFAKTYESDVRKMSYWLAPLREVPPSEGINPFELIDMENVRTVHARDPDHYWRPGMDEKEFVGKFMIDRWDKRRRGFSIMINPTLKPDDLLPNKSAKSKFSHSILDHSISLWKASREVHEHQWDHHQPVVDFDLLFHRIHYFIPPKARELKSVRGAVICPQPFRISFLRPEHVIMAMLIPSLIHRIEDTMVAMEGMQTLGLDVTDPSLALETFTVDLAADSGDDLMLIDDIQRLNVIRTMGPSYERFEFLGDTFLKMAVSIELYCASNSGRGKEFQLHENRKLLVCNSNMFETAREMGLVQFARTSMFSRRAWYPQGLKLVEGKKTESEDAQFRLSDKSVADFCEAAIGACFVQHYHQDSWKPADWDAAIKAVAVVTTNAISLDLPKTSGGGLRPHVSRCFSDYVNMYKYPVWSLKAPTEYMQQLGENIFLADGYRFKNLRLLQSAFTHQTSVLTGLDAVPSYQLLEFLGDALLDLACVEYLHFTFPDRGPEWMTKHKMALVSNQFFSVLSIKLGLGRHISHCSTAITHAIEVFSDQVETAMAAPDAAIDFWTRLPEAPKFLSDVVEAYVGALFIDSGFDFNEIRRFFRSNVLPYFQSISLYDSFASKHPVNALQRILDRSIRCQSAILRAAPVLGPPIPNTIDPDSGKPKRKEFFVGAVLVHDRILAQYVATSARLAKTGVAKQGVAILEEMSREEYQKIYECDCQEKGRKDIFT